jgi:hypothetical protein
MYYGRYERLYVLRDAYDAAVQAALAAGTEPKNVGKNKEVLTAGLELATHQRALTKALTADRKTAANTGVSLDARTSKPKTTQDFLGLILKEQRTAAESLSRIATVCSWFSRRLIAANSKSGSRLLR